MMSLCLPATLDSLDEIGKYVVAATSEAGLDTKPAYGLRLAVDEIATNIITHGYEEAGIDGNISISAELTASTLKIVIEDTGIPFDPLSRKLPGEDILNLPLEERDIGGLGIFLVLKGVDDFSYVFTDGKNRNIFVMNLAGHN
ncbi:MAG: ATP-binding protein [Desulfuromonadaceae bacterium]|nr:ATP-binding protein [Desulfuromonadaceae bacterium]MDD2854716.1 ATP-binding protein [Desulfuromonadaceae bacterium]